MFAKSDKSTFKYWFAHWASFQMTALNLGMWRWRFLFHDWYKPWLKLFMSYEKLQKFHRSNSNHHPEYRGKRSYDILEMVIDWECSRFTKIEGQLNARDTMNSQYPEMKRLMEPYLNYLKL